MYPTLHLREPAPPSRARVFSRGDGAGAGSAADRGVALRFERVAGEVVRFEIGVEVGLPPVAQGIDLQAAGGVGGVDLHQRERGAGAGLEALAA